MVTIRAFWRRTIILPWPCSQRTRQSLSCQKLVRQDDLTGLRLHVCRMRKGISKLFSDIRLWKLKQRRLSFRDQHPGPLLVADAAECDRLVYAFQRQVVAGDANGMAGKFLNVDFSRRYRMALRAIQRAVFRFAVRKTRPLVSIRRICLSEIRGIEGSR